LIEQPFLSRQRTILSGQYFIFPEFELRRDVALGIFQRLAATIVLRDLVRLSAADFYKESVYTIELYAKRGDTSARAFASLEFEQVAPARLIRAEADAVAAAKAGV